MNALASPRFLGRFLVTLSPLAEPYMNPMPSGLAVKMSLSSPCVLSRVERTVEDLPVIMRHIIKLLDVKEWGKISPLVVVD
jgi:hypothetical protein